MKLDKFPKEQRTKTKATPVVYLDKLAKRDPQMWFDMVTFKYFVAGDMGNPIPVEWGRERFRAFLKTRGGKDA